MQPQQRTLSARLVKMPVAQSLFENCRPTPDFLSAFFLNVFFDYTCLDALHLYCFAGILS